MTGSKSYKNVKMLDLKAIDGWIDKVTGVVSAGRTFRLIPNGPGRHLAIDRAFDMAPHLCQLGFRVRIAITEIEMR